MNHTEVIAPQERAEHAIHLIVDVVIAQLGPATIDAQRDMHRMRRIQLRPTPMRSSSTNAGLLASRTATLTTTSRGALFGNAHDDLFDLWIRQCRFGLTLAIEILQ